MMRTLLVLAALVACSEAFGGGAKGAPKKAAVKKSSGSFSPESDIGVTAPLGLFDPLNFLSRGPDAYRRYQEIEIKHGRLSMAATLGIIVTEAGIRFPGCLP